MKKYILGMIMLVSGSAYADFNVGIGVSDVLFEKPYGAVYRIGWEENDKYPWVANIEYFEERGPQSRIVEDHVSLSVGKRLVDYEYSRWNVYLDFGLSGFDKKVSSNSLHWAFFEEAGVKYDRYRFFIKHTSTAGFGEHNRGENILGVAIDF